MLGMLVVLVALAIACVACVAWVAWVAWTRERLPADSDSDSDSDSSTDSDSDSDSSTDSTDCGPSGGGLPVEGFSLVPLSAEAPPDTRGKNVWILWLQGFDGAPPLVRHVVDSWVRWNPGWGVRLVTRANLPTFLAPDDPLLGYIDRVDGVEAKSDAVRLALMAGQGGVWADATMLCLAPLDLYAYEALDTRAGFWMYHGGGPSCAGPASWFMISKRGSPLATRWKAACDTYWVGLADSAAWHGKTKTAVETYLWMDALFAQLVASDAGFAAAWGQVSRRRRLCCDDAGQPHALAGRLDGTDRALQDTIARVQPYMMKLSRKVRLPGGEPDPASNYGMILRMSRDTARAPAKNPWMPWMPSTPSPDGDSADGGPTWRSSVVVVVASYCDLLPELFALCAQHNAQPFIYDKCGLCRDYADADCEPLPNVGREGHTFAHFAVEYYDRLPQDIILLPGNLGPKHNRLERFKALLQAPRHTTSCEAETTEAEADFTLDVYEGTNMHPASVRPFRKWFERFVGPWDPAPGRGPCWNGIMRTTRERIRAKPRSFYEAILGELAAANSPEAAHFVERSMAAIF